MTLIAARSAVMAQLCRCPVCGAAVISAEKSDNLATVEFDCDAAFFLQTGSVIAVARICSAPTYVAIQHLERQAEQLSAKETA
jgi:hypothetical protein